MYNRKRYKYYNSFWYSMEPNLITKLIKKPTKKGEQYYFNIPIEFIRENKITLNTRYEIHIFEI